MTAPSYDIQEPIDKMSGFYCLQESKTRIIPKNTKLINFLIPKIRKDKKKLGRRSRESPVNMVFIGYCNSLG